MELYAYEEDIEYLQSTMGRVTAEQVVANPGRMVILRQCREQAEGKSFTYAEDHDLAGALTSNLIKNSSAVRLETLHILLRFETLKFEKAEDPEKIVSDSFVDQPCRVLELMLQYEQKEIGFVYEKDKQLQIQRIEAMVKSGVMPERYLAMVYDFLVGSLWVKFAPLFDCIISCLQTVFTHASSELQKKLLTKHCRLLRTMSWLSQLGEHENDSLMKLLLASLNKRQVASDSTLAAAYLRENQLEEEFLEIKDFFFQNCRGLGGVLSQHILPQK